MSDRLLEKLRGARPGWLARDLAEAAVAASGVDLAAALRELRARGYEIDERDALGLTLRSEPDTLDADRIRRDLHTRVVGRRVHVYERVRSTSDVIRELADEGAEEGTVVFAERQTRGRGRLGRRWWSPAGVGVWMSVLLRPPVRRESVPMTTIIGALAAADAIRSSVGLPAMIRWPNDVLVGDRKVAGVLVEARETAVGRDLVLGIGIDVNAGQGEFPAEIAGRATSLSEAAGERVNRLDLIRALLRHLDRWYRIKLGRDLEAINDRWRELSATRGRRIVLEARGRRFAGTVADVDVRFGIALRMSRGNIRHFRGEHVTVIEHGAAG
ncbi:MAG: biotin--[acetyl-CoA-carboxylase] ligase [bacterium]